MGKLAECLWGRFSHDACSYGRIETLSGFANGIFLILISIFIVFEAIQRLCVHSFWILDIHSREFTSRLDPPEMNTSQLLLVSSLGLAVNLFGMFAMGGHHHHVRSTYPIEGNQQLIGLLLPDTTGRAFALSWA